MKQLRYSRFGEPGEVLELVDGETQPVGAGDVAVVVEAAPIHNGDLMNVAGLVGFRHADLPRVPGIEGVGRIVEVGPEVEGLKPHDRVLFRCSSHGGVYTPYYAGSWQERVCVPADRVYPAPEIDAAQLANIVNVVTAEFILRATIDLEKGEWILQNGANSNVGRYLVRLASMRGYRTVNVVRRDASVPELEALGADAVVTDGPELAARVRAATGGQPIRLGIDCVAGDATTRIAECLADGGTVFNYGRMSGEPCNMNYTQLVRRDIGLRGYFMGRPFAGLNRPEQRQIIADLTDLVADGTLVAKIAGAYPLEQYREAVTHAAKSGEERDGKVIFRMDPSFER